MQFYIYQILIAMDQLFNAVFGGWADETLSARSHRCQWRLEWYIDRLFFWDKDGAGKFNHCKSSYEHEKQRLDLPEEYRKWKQECKRCKN